ncbi:MAG TPA: hypothetical protein VGK48_11195 [Terriglobia bacterium]
MSRFRADEGHGLRLIPGLILLTVAAVAIHGYSIGVEDQDVYLAAAKKWLDPSLYPVNAEFFTEQMKASLFIPALSLTARVVGMEWALALWHVTSIFLVLLGCWRFAALCFSGNHARWAAVLLVTVMLTMPIAGTALYPVDQYLHPRAPAAAAILLAIAASLRRRWTRTAIWMAFAAAMHPLMAAFGISLLVFLWIPWRSPTVIASAVFALLPWGLFEKVSPAWKEATLARSYYFPLRWEWYEWLGMVAPVAFVWWAGRVARRRGWLALDRIAVRLVAFAVFQFLIAMVMTVPASTIELAALQPMRWLHIFYFFFLIIAGGLAGEFLLKRRIWAWFLMFGGLACVMFGVQLSLFAHSDHIEWPGRAPRNPWAQAFLWIRANTPRDAVFALDPKYMDLPGEEAYGFRAWAERSILAEDQKDPGAATVFPEMAPKWLQQVSAQRGIEKFTAGQFEDLRRRFGADWVLLPGGSKVSLDCPFRNSAAAVCRIH